MITARHYSSLLILPAIKLRQRVRDASGPGDERIGARRRIERARASGTGRPLRNRPIRVIRVICGPKFLTADHADVRG